MLTQLRKGIGTWVAKIFIGILILSFAVWGVSGIALTSSNQTLASVGDIELSRQDYERLFPIVVNQWNQRLRTRLSRQQIRAFDIPSQVKTQLINQAAVDSHTQSLGLGVSDAAIADAIKNDPQLQDEAGRFNKVLLKEILRSQRMSDDQYFHEQRVSAQRTQITSLFTQKKLVSDALINSLYHHREDKLKVAYFVMPATAAKPVKEPSEADLQALYNNSKASYRAPEYRKVALFVLSQADLAKKVSVTDEQLNKLYAAREKRYVTPERRVYEQILFENKEKALEAHKALTKGDKFADVAKKFGKDGKATKFGPVAKADMADASLATVVFGLAKDGFSEPVEGTFALSLVKVTAIEPRVQKALKDVRAELSKVLQERAARAEIKKLYDKVEDIRAGGVSIEELAKEMGGTAVVIDAMDAKGVGLDGKAVKTLPATKKLSAAVFQSDIGEDTLPVRHQDGGYVWYDVLQIIPSRLKPFSEVKKEVRAAWLVQEKQKLASEAAATLAKRLESGEKFDKVAKSLKAKVITPDAFGRGSVAKDIPAFFANRLFSVKANGIATGLDSNNKSWLIVKVLEHLPAKTSGPAYDAYKTKLNNELQVELTGDFVDQYLKGLRAHYEVEENAQLFEQLKSGL